MPRTFVPLKSIKNHVLSFYKLYKPIRDAIPTMPPLESRGNRPLQMSFEEHLKAMIFFHLQEHTSAQHLLQALEEDDFARSEIAPIGGIKKSSLSEATNTRGLEQFMHIFEHVQKQASRILPNCHRPLPRRNRCNRSRLSVSRQVRSMAGARGALFVPYQGKNQKNRYRGSPCGAREHRFL